MTVVVSSPPRTRRSSDLRWAIFVGVFAVPCVLALAFNSWEAPDAEAYVRMAFALVAGQTIAIATAAAVLALAVRRRYPATSITGYAFVFLLVLFTAYGMLGSATANVLHGLGATG